MGLDFLSFATARAPGPRAPDLARNQKPKSLPCLSTNSRSYTTLNPEGRALQDVYVLRSTAEKEASRVIGIGTAIRFPETGTDTWRVVYVGPMKGYLYTFSARKIGDEIVLEGKSKDGAPMRWIFSEIKPRSFHWRAVVSADDGKTWQLRQEMSVRRIAN